MRPGPSPTNRKADVALIAMIALLAIFATPARAARPLLDTHQWDAYFALFARDAVVPWKRITVRLDTYSGAPVDFAAYAVDPADVIVAGPGQNARPLATAGRSPVAHWRFTPPPGYNFESNDVEVPLQNREGFYVLEARRGEAAQQVWLNVTRVGLVAKEGPDGVLVYGTDLRTGRALAGMRVEWLVGTRLVTTKTDQQGVARWAGSGRPSFALAEWGASRTFVSLLPVAPVPGAVAGVRVDRDVVRAGDSVNFVGFVRKRNAQEFRPATGEVRLTIAGSGHTLATQTVRLDDAGAFSGAIAIPPQTRAGDYVVLASGDGATGGTTIHVDAAGDIRLTAASGCTPRCAADAPVPIAISAQRAGEPAQVPVRVRVVRSPHVVAPGDPPDQRRWGTTQILDQTVRTDANGRATVTIPAPTDGLDSTYGVDVAGGGATQTLQIVATSARYALSVKPDDTSVDVGAPVGAEIFGFDPADGAPAADRTIDVKLSHGPNAANQTVTLDATGHAHVAFVGPQLGSNLMIASMDVDGKTVLDASEVTIEPRALGATTAGGSHGLAIKLDRDRYRPGESITVTAQADGAVGQALVTLDGTKTVDAKTVPIRDGRAVALLTLGATAGDVHVSVALVRDGATLTASVPVAVDGPGHPRLTALVPDRASYAPGEVAKVAIRDGDLRGPATVAIRLADSLPSAGIGFAGAPELLAVGGATTLSPTTSDPDWHAWVAPARSTAADIFSLGSEQGTAPQTAPTLGAEASAPLLWRVERTESETLEVPLPHVPGRYVVSILKIADDGDVGTAAVTLTVQ